MYLVINDITPAEDVWLLSIGESLIEGQSVRITILGPARRGSAVYKVEDTHAVEYLLKEFTTQCREGIDPSVERILIP